jgi:hypothetical protein
MYSGSSWLRIEAVGRLLWLRWWTLLYVNNWSRHTDIVRVTFVGHKLKVSQCRHLVFVHNSHHTVYGHVHYLFPYQIQSSSCLSVIVIRPEAKSMPQPYCFTVYKNWRQEWQTIFCLDCQVN